MRTAWLSVLLLAGCGQAALPTAMPARPAGVAAQALTPERFFANAKTQAAAPEAFAVSPLAVPALEAIARVAPAQRAALVAAVQADPALATGVKAFATLGWAARKPLLRRIVALEAVTFGVAAPTFVIHDEPGQGPAFFEFDVTKPGTTGTVHLWTPQLDEEKEPYAALLLAVHETRHSWQFQTAFPAARGSRRGAEPALAPAFAAGFKAQKALQGKLTFCDFCTLHHEHEAFQTGNAVVGTLAGSTVDTHDMGCLSSQFGADGAPRLDLLALAREVGPQGLLAAFNEREKPQFLALGGSFR